MTLDDARKAMPQLGFALYAYEPGQEVTLEIHAPDGEVYVFKAGTEEQVFALAFPPPPHDVFD